MLNHTKIQKKPDKNKMNPQQLRTIQNCKAQNKCCLASQTHKTITGYRPEMQKSNEQK